MHFIIYTLELIVAKFLDSLAHIFGSSESEFITFTVKEVLERLSVQKGENPSLFLSTEKGKSTDMPTGKGHKHETYLNKCHIFGMEQRMEQLEKKLEFDCKETRIIGVVGMPGIGKTTLAMMLHEKWSYKFIRCVPLLGIRKKSEEYGTVWLRKTLLEVLLEGEFPMISDETTHGLVKAELLQTKIFAVLDDVGDKKQLEFLLGGLDWIKKGSKIVITTSDKSLLEGFAHDTYVVPLLNNKDAFQLLTYHAFYNQISHSKTLLSLSRVFVDNVGGNPLALKLLGCQLYQKTKEQWKEKLLQLTCGSNSEIREVLMFSIDQLNKRQKDAFLDIVLFFRSENEYFVRSLLDSDPDSTDVVSEVRDLANKFLITISESRVEVNLYTLCKYLGSPERHRLCTYEDIINKLMTMEKPVPLLFFFFPAKDKIESCSQHFLAAL